MEAPSYLTFCGLSISYDARVLQPRPWTEAQAGWAAELLATAPPGPVLELCAGVGHIGLGAVRHSQRRLLMVDRDPIAHRFAERNAAANDLSSRTEFRLAEMKGSWPRTNGSPSSSPTLPGSAPRRLRSSRKIRRAAQPCSNCGMPSKRRPSPSTLASFARTPSPWGRPGSSTAGSPRIWHADQTRAAQTRPSGLRQTFLDPLF